MKVFAIKLTAFLVLIYSLLFLLDVYYTKYFSTHLNVCEKSQWILKHKNEKYDFVFLGNSRAEQVINVNLMERLTESKGINIGITGSNYAENYLVLDQFLKSKNTIKNLVVQVGLHSLNSTMELEYPFHNYNYMFLFKDSVVDKIYKDNNSLYRYMLWKYVPFSRYMEFSHRFSLYKVLKGGFECDKSNFDYSKGSAVETNKKLDLDEIYNYVDWNINSLDLKYLKKIMARAEKDSINLILYSAPMFVKYRTYQRNCDEMYNEIRSIALKENIPFFDFSAIDNELCSNPNYFNDKIHMNIVGTDKFTTIFADSLNTKNVFN